MNSFDFFPSFWFLIFYILWKRALIYSSCFLLIISSCLFIFFCCSSSIRQLSSFCKSDIIFFIYYSLSYCFNFWWISAFFIRSYIFLENLFTLNIYNLILLSNSSLSFSWFLFYSSIIWICCKSNCFIFVSHSFPNWITYSSCIYYIFKISTSCFNFKFFCCLLSSLFL